VAEQVAAVELTQQVAQVQRAHFSFTLSQQFKG
jgi:hypothetical protein